MTEVMESQMLQTVAVYHELEMRCHIGRRYQLAHIITAHKTVIGFIKTVTDERRFKKYDCNRIRAIKKDRKPL